MSDSKVYNYDEELALANLTIEERTSRNATRFLQAIRKLETAGERDSCIVCGEVTYKDACVLIRPGEWVSPRSFHANSCILHKTMMEFHSEIVKEEEQVQNIWRYTRGREIWKDAVSRAKKILKDLK